MARRRYWQQSQLSDCSQRCWEMACGTRPRGALSRYHSRSSCGNAAGLRNCARDSHKTEDGVRRIIQTYNRRALPWSNRISTRTIHEHVLPTSSIQLRAAPRGSRSKAAIWDVTAIPLGLELPQGVPAGAEGEYSVSSCWSAVRLLFSSNCHDRSDRSTQRVTSAAPHTHGELQC